jgi:hypothetical protein
MVSAGDSLVPPTARLGWSVPLTRPSATFSPQIGRRPCRVLIYLSITREPGRLLNEIWGSAGSSSNLLGD